MSENGVLVFQKTDGTIRDRLLLFDILCFNIQFNFLFSFHSGKVFLFFCELLGIRFSANL